LLLLVEVAVARQLHLVAEVVVAALAGLELEQVYL
jgi:hypothetical protein